MDTARFDVPRAPTGALRQALGTTDDAVVVGCLAHLVPVKGHPTLLDAITEGGAFSIMDVYLRLAAAGERIAHHDISASRWLEIGSPTRLDAARRALGG